MKKYILLIAIVTSVFWAQTPRAKKINNVEVFTERFATLLVKMGSSSNFEFSKTDTGTNGDMVVTLTAGKLQAITFTVDDLGIKSFIYIGTGSGTASSGLEIGFSSVAAVGALRKRQLTKRERGDMLGRILTKKALDGDTSSSHFAGYKITSTLSDFMGFVVTADRL